MKTFELLKSLVPQNSSQKIDWQSLHDLIPALDKLANTPQDPIFHGEGDVLVHTRMVCESLLSLQDYQDADPERKFILFYASLLHDIGKPVCTATEPDGRITSMGHSKRGEVDARILLWRAGVPFILRESICRIIRVHQVPFFAFSENRAGHSAEFLVRKLSWEVNLRDLTSIAEADIRGRISTNQESTLVSIELFRELAQEEACFETARNFPDPATRMAYFRSEGGISPNHPFFTEEGSRVTVLSGLPASGKDTWISEHGKNRPVISFDDVIEELGVKHGSNAAGKAIHLAIDRAKELLRKKQPFIWNATHLSRQMRDKTLDLLYRYGASVELVYLEAAETEIKRRNNGRNSTLTNMSIQKMLHRWEVPLPSEAHGISYLPAEEQQYLTTPL